MNILFTNDDGYDAIGINTAYEEFAPHYNIYMCAPLRHKSAFSHAINAWDDLELIELTGKTKGFALDGTPADCAKAATLGLFGNLKFDLVLSGINFGINAAQDIFYSGTVGAAREAMFQGVFAIASSLDIRLDLDHDEASAPEIFAYSARILRRIVEALPPKILTYKDSIININFPYTLSAKGIKCAQLGKHDYNTRVNVFEKEGTSFLNFSSRSTHPAASTEHDLSLLDENYVVVTALYHGVVLDPVFQKKLLFLEDISLENI